MENTRIKVDLLKELQSSILPSNEEIENILKDFDEEEFERESDKKLNFSPLKKRTSNTELKLSWTGKRYKPELRSYTNFKSFSMTHNAGTKLIFVLTFSCFTFWNFDIQTLFYHIIVILDNFKLGDNQNLLDPLLRTRSYMPRSAGKF